MNESNQLCKKFHFFYKESKRFNSFKIIFSFVWSTLARGIDKSWLLIIDTWGDLDQNYSYLNFLSLKRLSFEAYIFDSFSSHYLSRYCSLVTTFGLFSLFGYSSVFLFTAATTYLLLRVNAARYSFLASVYILWILLIYSRSWISYYCRRFICFLCSSASIYNYIWSFWPAE